MKREKYTTGSEVAWWVRQLGTLKLIDITADHIRRALNEFAKGDALRGDGVDRKTMRAETKSAGRKRSAATVNRRKATLSSVLKFAMQQGYFTTAETVLWSHYAVYFRAEEDCPFRLFQVEGGCCSV